MLTMLPITVSKLSAKVTSSLQLMCWLLLLLILGSQNSTAANLITVPNNTITMESTPVTLQCRMSPDDVCYWRQIERNEVPVTIYDADRGSAEDSAYGINTSMPGQCDMTIKEPKMVSSLTYCCQAGSFGQEACANLAVLQTNLICSDNALDGQPKVIGQRIHHVIQLTYASSMKFSTYMDGPNGSRLENCTEETDRNNITELKCHYYFTVNESHLTESRSNRHEFYAAVSSVNAKTSTTNKNPPSMRLYCPRGDQAKMVNDHAPTNAVSANITDHQNPNAMHEVTSESLHEPQRHNVSIGFSVKELIVILIVLLLSVILVSVVMLIWCIFIKRKKQQDPERSKKFSDTTNSLLR